MKATLDYFKRALVSSNPVSFSKLNELASRVGYLVHPLVCNEEVMEWLKSQQVNYNATFYKAWADITTKSRFELLLDQIQHYASTYGTNFEGIPFIPNNGSDFIAFRDLKMILPITKEELFKKCEAMVNSGIALKEQTVKDVIEMVKETGFKLDIHKVKNKEAKMHLYKATETLPINNEEMVRFLLFCATGKTMVIKDKDTISAVKANRFNYAALIEEYGVKKLSESFYRYKPLFLAMRNSPVNKTVVNKLRNLARTTHIPYQPGYFEQILSNPSLVSKLEEMLPQLNNFKKVTLLQTILIRNKNLNIRPFVVRNQKLFMKEEKTPTKSYYQIIYDMVYFSLIDSLSKKATTVKMSDVLHLTLPTSEKSFIGNVPLGTYISFADKDAIVGVNWRNEGGIRDLDLSATNIDGTRVGWNTNYYTGKQDVVYSGDVTSAHPEATELLYMTDNFAPLVVKANVYSGGDGGKFKLFVATEKIKNLHRNYMVDPNNVVFETELEMTSKEMIFGIAQPGKFMLANFRTGNKRVSGLSITDNYAQYTLDTADCYLYVKDVLEDAGFTFQNEEFELDLSFPDKSALIELLR